MYQDKIFELYTSLEGDNTPNSYVLYYMAYGLVPLSLRQDRSIVE
jgi:hypothetical protein